MGSLIVGHDWATFTSTGKKKKSFIVVWEALIQTDNSKSSVLIGFIPLNFLFLPFPLGNPIEELDGLQAMGVAKVRCDLGTKPPSPLKHHLHCYSSACRLFHFVSSNLCTLKAGRRTGIVFAFHFYSQRKLFPAHLHIADPIHPVVSPLSQLDSVGPSR